MTQPTGYGGFSGAGLTAALYTQEREIIWGGSDTRLQILYKNSVVDGSIRDAGNSPTTLIRRGLLLGKITATGKQLQWDATATDGSQDLSSVNNMELRAQDFNAVDTDRVFATILQAPLIAGQLLIKGLALVGHTDEYLARRMLRNAGCVLDDDPMGYLAGAPRSPSYEAATTDTLTADQNGMTLYYPNAASVTVTLPAIKPGLEYTLVRVADEEFIVVSPTADNVIVGNDLSADGVTFTTSGEQIGATVFVKSEYVNGTLKWRMILPPPPFGTGTATLTYSIQS